MKNLILIFISVATLSLGACKKQDNAPNPVIIQPTSTCSPLASLEGNWKSDSVRYITKVNGIVVIDTNMVYNSPKGHMNLNFYCDNNIATMDGGTESVTFDPTKYRIFSDLIYIGPDGDTAQMDKMRINSIAGNHLVLKFGISKPSDTLVTYSYLSLRK